MYANPFENEARRAHRPVHRLVLHVDRRRNVDTARHIGYKFAKTKLSPLLVTEMVMAIADRYIGFEHIFSALLAPARKIRLLAEVQTPKLRNSYLRSSPIGLIGPPSVQMSHEAANLVEAIQTQHLLDKSIQLCLRNRPDGNARAPVKFFHRLIDGH
jgi:hypothetical protein